MISIWYMIYIHWTILWNVPFSSPWGQGWAAPGAIGRHIFNISSAPKPRPSTAICLWAFFTAKSTPALSRGDECPRWSQLSHVESVMQSFQGRGSGFSGRHLPTFAQFPSPVLSSCVSKGRLREVKQPIVFPGFHQSPPPRRFPSIRDPEMNANSNLYPMQYCPRDSPSKFQGF